MGAFDLHTNVTTKRPLTMILCSEKTKPNQNIHISVRMRVHVSIAKPPHRSKHTHTHSVARTLTHTHNANEQQHKASHQQPNNNTRKNTRPTHMRCRTANRDGNRFGEGLSVFTSANETLTVKKHGVSERSNVLCF